MRLPVTIFASVWVMLAMPFVAGAQVVITHTPANVVTRNFDPKNHPPEMPPLKGNEAAVTQSKFACAVQMEVEIAQADGAKPTMKITAVQSTLTLDVIIWLPNKAPAKLRAHELGHRDISQKFYETGKSVAEAVGRKYIGKELKINSVEQSETQAALQQAANSFCEEYLGQVQVPSEAVQERYDRITDHGRKPISEKEAIRQAMESATTRK